MGARRKARELALQALFQAEHSGQPFDQAFDLFCANFEVSKKSAPYARELVLGTGSHWQEINRLIESSAENWRLERMSAIDRNIMRLAVFEICFQEDVPAEVAINEAVEIAKKYGADDSCSFINGILDAVKKSIAD